MNWPYLKRNVAFDLIGIVLVITTILVIATIGGYVWVIYPDLLRKTNRGFGPEWDCSMSVPKGTFCIKRPMKSDKSVETALPKAAPSGEHFARSE